MAIRANASRINPTLRRRNGGSRKQVYAGLFLTSMVDMFAILAIFLLQSFSSEGELIILPQGLELPKAQNVGTLEYAPSLVIAQDKILFEGKEIAKTQEVINQPEWVVPALQDALKNFKAPPGREPKPDPNADPDKPITQKINISADRRLQFHIIRKIIYNAGFAGFPDFRFAVFANGQPGVEAPQAN
jgi:biopolymer transport protein ExbD